MSNLYVDIILCGLVYCILLWIIIWRRRSNNNPGNGGDDDDGGIPVSKLPDLDLPPGVTLPSGSPSKKVDEYEEAFA